MALVGRADESAAVLRCIGDAAGGRASTLLVRGEAGIGKTSLIEEACRSAGPRVEPLWARCLPLTSMTTPLLPLRPVLRRAGLGDGVTLVEFDAWLDRAAADRPLALIVDDLHWADRSSLDVLLYAIAGPADRRLAVLATLRAGAESERLSGWLADVQRLPRVGELVLERLGRAETGELIAAVVGRLTDEGLVDDVYARTGGNPYLTSLLVRGLDPGATVLPAERPAGLRDAAIRPWRTMTPETRELARILAVGGHPQSYDRFTRIAPALGFTAPVLPALREAVDAGVLRAGADGRYWFTHPLLAEVLDGGLLPEQRRTMHAAYARVLDDGDPADPAALADHYDRAGMAEPAFRWAVRAAEVTVGAAEQLRLLRRALSRWPEVERPGMSRADLGERMRVAAEEAGREPDELEATEALIALLSSEAEPLRLGRLISRRAVLRGWMGLDGSIAGALREAVALTARHPHSVEHALTTARLAKELLLDADPGSVATAATALELAEACGAGEAVAEALVPSAYAKFWTGRPEAAEEDAARAWEMALSLRRFTTFKGAVYATLNLRRGATEREIAEIYRRAADELTAGGAPHSHVAEMCAQEASVRLWLGDWRTCRRRLRVALGARPGPRGDAVARLTAAELACLQGRQAEAERHLVRAEEIFRVHAAQLSLLPFGVVRAKVALGAGDPEQAFDISLDDLEHTRYVGEMLPIAARALADQAEACRDTGRDPAPVLARLAEFRRRYPVVVVEPVNVVPVEEQRAWQTRADAETARAGHDPAERALWHASAEASREAGMPWDDAYARWRLAQSALRDRGTRREAAEALRRAHRLAGELAMEPLRTEAERLARSARIDLTEIDQSTTPPPLPGLTRREREVLGYLLAGRTSAEIAKELVLSEKTVGVHISNMLRKTGTTNRIQLADLARRRGRNTLPRGG